MMCLIISLCHSVIMWVILHVRFVYLVHIAGLRDVTADRALRKHVHCDVGKDGTIVLD
jgi:hypothetical protein